MLRALLLTLLIGASGCGPRAARDEPVRYRRQVSGPAYAHYVRGRVAMLRDQPQRAVREFERAVHFAPLEPEPRVALIEALLVSGRIDDAHEAAVIARARWPERADVWFASGRVWRARKQYARAADDFHRAARAAPDRERYWLALAGACRKLGDRARERAAYDALLQHRPGSAHARYRFALRLVAWRDYAAAIRQLERAIAIDPDHLYARLVHADALRRAGRHARADASARDTFDRTGGDPGVAHRLLVDALEHGGARRAAHLVAVLDRADLDVGTRIELAYFALDAGDPDRALAIARSIRSYAPDEPAAFLLEGRALDAAGRTADAVALWLSAAPEDATYTLARADAGRALARRGDHARALAVVDEALAHRPEPGADRHELVIARSAVREHAGDTAGARDELESALDRAPQDLDLLFALALLESRAGNHARAERLAEQIMLIDPDHLGAINLLGYSLADRGADLDRAERLLRRALRLQPRNPYVLDSWGWLWLRKGDPARAVRLLTRAAALAPREPEILLHLAEAQRAAGDTPAARANLERAASLHPEGRVAKRIDALLVDLAEPR